MNRDGFTLIELLIVIAIVGILAAIVIPRFAAHKAKKEAERNPSVKQEQQVDQPKQKKLLFQ